MLTSLQPCLFHLELSVVLASTKGTAHTAAYLSAHPSFLLGYLMGNIEGITSSYYGD